MFGTGLLFVVAEWSDSCIACWTSKFTKFPLKSLHSALPGKWQFRLTLYDRAGNKGAPKIAV